MGNVERSVSFKPEEIPAAKEGSSDGMMQGPQIPKGRERLFEFWQQAGILGFRDALDPRRQRLIEAFLNPQTPTLQQLTTAAGVTSRERVRQLLVSSVKTAYPMMPNDYRQNNPLERLTNPGSSPEARDRMSQAHKGKVVSPETRDRISQAQRRRLQKEKGIHLP